MRTQVMLPESDGYSGRRSDQRLRFDLNNDFGGGVIVMRE